MMPEDAELFEKHGIHKIYIRTILGCRYSRRLRPVLRHEPGYFKEVDLGEAVGIIAAQSIGGPGTS